MRPRALLIAFALAALLCLPASASAAFGLLPGTEGFSVAMPKDALAASEAGTHPDQLAVHLGFNKSGQYTDADLRGAELELPAGMLANPTATAECQAAEFATPRDSPYEASLSGESCPDGSQVGVIAVHSSYGGAITRHFGLFNLAAPYGSAEAIGAAPFGIPLVFAGRLDPASATLSFELSNLSQELNVQSLDLTLWGTPWEVRHDPERGNCLNEADPAAFHGNPSTGGEPGDEGFQAGTCFVSEATSHIDSYLTLPTTCGASMRFTARVGAWGGGEDERSLLLSQGGNPVILNDCLEVLSIAKMQLRSDRAAAATGVVFRLDVNDGGGFRNVKGHVRSPIQSSSALLPEGLTINPSLGAGLGVCTQADFARESATSAPGSGCPNNSKIGEVSAEGLLGLAEPLTGNVFLAQPYANPTNNLLSLYITLASPRRGLYFRSYGSVDPDPASGRLSVSFKDLPPLHYDLFTLSLREGQRAAMIAPAACGAYAATLDSVPYSDPATHLLEKSSFLISHGEDGGPCPTGAALPFHPGLEAGSENGNAGAYSPYRLRMSRTDTEQEITSYSATLPAGLLGKIAAIPYCPDQAIEAARGRSGAAELADPSCPAASSVGHTLAGYGVGATLAYAPGGLYLSGPYHGAPLSITAIDSALVGPFDLGVVIVRSAIRIDPRTAQVSIDSQGSDPIPHILRGIPLHLRDIRVEVERPNFTINPTNCDPMASTSLLSGAGLDFASPADDSRAVSTDRYQLFNCSAHQLKPKLAVKLIGPTTRGRYPALKATYTPRRGDANLKRTSVALPPSIFLAQEHITEICTIPRFRAKTCPKGSQLGYAKARTPLMDEPLKGAVYARANPAHLLPDVVADISGRGIEIEVVGRIDKAPGGGLRATFSSLPDAPLTKFQMNLFGAQRSLLVNAANLCAAPQRAEARFIAHNNATAVTRPKLAIDCKKNKNKRNKDKRKGAKRR